jgi:predicted enzyme related to lactoylglutathione lyase
MAKIIGPSFLALQVRNLQASRTFYTEQLGLMVDLQTSTPDVVVFQAQPIPFAIREPLVDLDAVPHLAWGVVLWLLCDDAEALCASLKAHGTAIAQPPFDTPFGRAFRFVDPDGYTITVHQNP